VVYNPASQMTNATLPSGTETWGYNTLSQLTQRTTTSGSTTRMNMSYNYTAGNDNGQIASSTDAVTGETITYQYDSLKRLVNAYNTAAPLANPPLWSDAYTYDGFGNLTGMTGSGGAPSLSVSVNAPTNQISPTNILYDGNGNVTQFGPSGSLTTMAYNVANLMATANSTNAYAYDPANQRVYFRNSAGTETLYVYGTGGKKLATYTIAGITGSQVNFTMQSQNVYFAGKLISAEGNAVAVDRLGSVRWNAASGGHTYYPYGVEYSATTNDTEKYATYTRDTLTGLDYAKNRYYSRVPGADSRRRIRAMRACISRLRCPGTATRTRLATRLGGTILAVLILTTMGTTAALTAKCVSSAAAAEAGVAQAGEAAATATSDLARLGSAQTEVRRSFRTRRPGFSSSGEAGGGTYTFGSGDDPLNPTAQTVFGLVGQQMDGLPGLISEGTGAAILASTGIPTLAALGSTAVVALAGTGAVAAGATEAQYGFYSGLGAQQAAEAWQSSTAGAQLMSQLPPGVDPGAASASYAQSVSGTLQIFQSTVLEVGGTPSAWAGSEYPALLGNQNVTGTVINLTNAAGQVVSSTPTPWPWWP
jgi:YD repeat-containing protein